MKRYISTFLTGCAVAVAAAAADGFPTRPKPDEWKFPHEMAKFRAYVPNWTKPVPSGHCDLSGGLAVVDGYGLDGDLETVRTDLRRFLSETGLANPDGKKLHLVRGKVEDVKNSTGRNPERGEISGWFSVNFER